MVPKFFSRWMLMLDVRLLLDAASSAARKPCAPVAQGGPTPRLITLPTGMSVPDGQPMVPRAGMTRREKLELWQARRAAAAAQVRSPMDAS